MIRLHNVSVKNTYKNTAQDPNAGNSHVAERPKSEDSKTRPMQAPGHNDSIFDFYAMY